MATMVITTRKGSVELSPVRTEQKLNPVQAFLTGVQAKIEQMPLKSDKDINAWNMTFKTFEAQIPESLSPEAKKALQKGLTEIRTQRKPERAWELLQELYAKVQ